MVSDLKEPIYCLNTQSGCRSPLKRLSESREEVAVLESFESLFASLWQLQEPRAPKMALKPFLGARKPFLDYTKCVSALQASLDD